MIQEWYYKGDADITIGEVHISNRARIILIILVISMVIVGGLGIYFRNYIYDYLVNPSIQLAERDIVNNPKAAIFGSNGEKFDTINDNTVYLEVHTKFNPYEYIANVSSGKDLYATNTDAIATNTDATNTDATAQQKTSFSFTIEGADFDVDTLGTYKVKYISKNRMHTNEETLKVIVVDTTAPIVTLKKNVVTLVREKDLADFDAKVYLDKVEDNYTSKEKLLISYGTVNFDKTKEEEADKESVSITRELLYSAEDEAGNVGVNTLSIVIFDTEEDKQEKEEQEKEDNNKDNKDNNKPQKTTEAPVAEQPTTQAPTTQAPTTEQPTTQAPSPYISGVYNITATSLDDAWSQLESMFYSASFSGSSLSFDASSVNGTVSGTYPVYWTSSDCSTTTYVTINVD